MFNIQKFLSHAVLALAMATGAGAALAGPVYHITLDSSGLGQPAGYIDFTFLAVGPALPATATLSNFTGAYGAFQVTEGEASGSIPGIVTIGNGGGFNDLLASANFGGLFSFDLSFDVADGAAGTTFGVAFINEAFDSYLGVAGNFLEINVQPAFAGSPATFDVSADSRFASVTAAAVPEPSGVLLMMTGMGLVGFTMRRRRTPAAR
jgi:hypothetical protein